MRFLLFITALLLSMTVSAHETGYVVTTKVFKGDQLVARQSYTVEDRQFAVISFPKDEDETFRLSVVGTPKEQNEITVRVNILLDMKSYSPRFHAKIGEDVKLRIDSMSFEFRIEALSEDNA